MKLRIAYLLVIPIMGLLHSNGCRKPQTMPPATQPHVKNSQPNIVLITLCSFRMAHTGLENYNRPTTPFLDSLKKEGVFFENAYSSSSWTKPSVTSIMTGLTPNVHRMTDMFGDQTIIKNDTTPRRILAESITTLGETLQQSGFDTFARINNVQAGEFFQIPQGFDDVITSHEMKTRDMLSDFEQWLNNQDSDNPFFFFILSRDAHMPYMPPYDYYLEFNRSPKTIPKQGYRKYCRGLEAKIRQMLKDHERVPIGMRNQFIDLYDAGIAAMDAELVRILPILRDAGRLDNTIIIVMADHGERFFEHGKIGHAGPTDEAVIRIPLLFYGQGIPKGRTVEPVVRNIDVYPTIAEYVGAEIPEVVMGTSLLPLVFGDNSEIPNLTAFSSYMEKHHSLRDRRMKLHIWQDGKRTLHDLYDDPSEQRDILLEEPDIAARLEQELFRWLDEEEALRKLVEAGDTRELTDEVIEQLKTLGYIR